MKKLLILLIIPFLFACEKNITPPKIESQKAAQELRNSSDIYAYLDLQWNFDDNKLKAAYPFYKEDKMNGAIVDWQKIGGTYVQVTSPAYQGKSMKVTVNKQNGGILKSYNSQTYGGQTAGGQWVSPRLYVAPDTNAPDGIWIQICKSSTVIASKYVDFTVLGVHQWKKISMPFTQIEGNPYYNIKILGTNSGTFFLDHMVQRVGTFKESINKRHAINKGAVWNYFTDKDGGSDCINLVYGGEGDLLNVPDNNILSFTNQVTFSGWINRMAGYMHALYRKVGEYDIRVQTNNLIYAKFWDAQGDGYLAVGSIPIPLNTWAHVAVVLDNGTAEIYVNGMPCKYYEKYTGTFDGLSNTSNDLFIGSPMTASIQNFEVFRAAADSLQIQEIINN